MFTVYNLQLHLVVWLWKRSHTFSRQKRMFFFVRITFICGINFLVYYSNMYPKLRRNFAIDQKLLVDWNGTDQSWRHLAITDTVHWNWFFWKVLDLPYPECSLQCKLQQCYNEDRRKYHMILSNMLLSNHLLLRESLSIRNRWVFRKNKVTTKKLCQLCKQQKYRIEFYKR